MRIPKLCKNGDGRAFVIYPHSKGRREYLGVYGEEDTDRRYREWVTRFLNSGGNLIQEKKQNEYFIVELVSHYLDYIKSKKTKKQYGQIWINLQRLITLCGSLPAIETGPRTLIQYQTLMANETYEIKKDVFQSYTREHVNKAVRQIKDFFKWCCKFEYLPPEHHLKFECVDNLKLGELGLRDNPPVKGVPLNTVKKTLPYLNSVVKVMVQVQYYCGMRPGEVCRLNWEEIDRTHDVWVYVPTDHKTKNKNWILAKAIPKPAQELLQDSIFQNQYVFDPNVHGNGLKNRQYYTVEAYASAVERACKKAIEKGEIDSAWTPNQLRHAIGTDMRAIHGMEAAQDYLGHSTMNTTEIYAERLIGRLIELGRTFKSDVFNGENNEKSTAEDRTDQKEI